VKRPLALLIAVLALGSAVSPAPAWAHSPTDFLKVSVGKPSTILLPPMTALPGRMEVTISSPAFQLVAASAGPGWRTRLASAAAVLDGRRAAGQSLLVSVTGTAHRAGRLPIDVRVSSPSAPSESYHWRITALAGYLQPVSSLAGASKPDRPVAVQAGHPYRLWPLSLAFAFAALLVLVVRRPTRPSTR
jgi:hypothetical protein